MRAAASLAALCAACSYQVIAATDGADETDAIDRDSADPDGPYPDAIDAAFDPIPPDVPGDLRQASIVHSLPPPTHPYPGGWVHALHDSRLGGSNSSVEVDYMVLYAVVDGTEAPLVGMEMPEPYNGIRWAQTALRSPWYTDVRPETWTAASATWTFQPGSNPMRLWHWGTDRASSIPAGATHLVMKVGLRVTGPALVLVGVDDWTALSGGTSVHAGISGWYFAAPGFQDIVLSLAP